MKKQMAAPLLLAVLVLVCAACSSTQKGRVPDICKGAPSWVCKPDIKDGIAAVGYAKIGMAGFAFARTEAMANGRDELARQINLKVQNMVKTFTQATGLGDDEAVDRVSSQVSRQMSNQVLVGSKQKAMWQSPTGDLHVWMVMDPESVRMAAKAAVTSSYKNNAALWQQFQAKKAYEELDAVIAKEFKDFTD